jgi:predicted O-methyltransferase YrrM
MQDFTIEDIKAICLSEKLPLGIPFIDKRLDDYQAKYNGAYPYYAVLRGITRALEPKVVVELGTWQGTSGACLAAGYPDCEVITMDHHSDPGDDFNINQTIIACTEFKNLSYINGCTCDAVHKVKPGSRYAFPDFLNVLGDRKIDILFIDSWHVYEYAKADFDTYYPLLAKTSLVICDDITGGDSSGHQGMETFWKGLPGEKHLDGWVHAGYPMGFTKIVKE